MIEHVTIPVSATVRRLTQLRVFLASYAKTARRNHDLVFVTEDPGLNAWIRDEVRSYERPWRIRVMLVEPLPLGPHNPVYQFLNVGAAMAEEPWIMTPAGDDTYFPPHWERLLDRGMSGTSLAWRTVWVPRYVSTQPAAGAPPGFVTVAQAKPVEYVIGAHWEGVDEAEVLRHVEGWRRSELVSELSGERTDVSWPHTVIHRDLFAAVGGYKTVPPFPAGNDMAFGDALRDRGVMAIGVNDAVIVNARVPIRMG